MPEGDTSQAVRRRLNTHDVFVRDLRAVRILEKVSARTNADNAATLAKTIRGSNPFGIRAHLVPTDAATVRTPAQTILLGTKDGDRYVERSQIPKSHELLDQWKVTISNTSSEHAGNPDTGGRKRVLTDRARVLSPGSACTETYLVAGVFSEEDTATAFLAYLRTKFCRFLLSLRVATQHITRGCFAFVPAMPTDRIWTDEDLYDHFGLDEEDIAHIDSLIKEMPR